MNFNALCSARAFNRRTFTKMLLIMKFTAIFLFIASMQVSANGFAQVSISEKKVPLSKIFKIIKKQSGYNFLYNSELIQKSGTVSINVNNVSVFEAIQKCLQGKKLTYSIIENTILIKPVGEISTDISNDHFPTLIDVRGKVVDENGEPVDGASVSVKGERVGTYTNAKGEFEMKGVNDNAILVITGVSIKTIEISLKGQSTLPIITVIKLIKENLTVTVNTGYQSISKERSAGAFAKADMEILKNRSSSMNVLQRLDGLIPGLTVNNSPGSSQNPFLIRGLSTIGIKDPNNSSNYTGTNRSPLYVVDGIPLDDVSSINPQDVADITVLKDATAASIWGARASNGVIVITTKKGGRNEKIKIQYDGFINLQGKPDLNYIPVLNSKRFIQAAKDVFDPVSYPWNTASSYTNLGNTGIAPHEMILYNQYRGIISATQANASLDSLGNINNVQQIGDLWYRNAALMNHTVSISGGGRLHSFYGSLAYTDLQSGRPGEQNNSYKVNLRQDFTFNKNIQLYLITDLSNTITSAMRNINIDNRFYPYQLFKDADGNNISMPYMGYLSDSLRMNFQTRSQVNLDYNPLDEYNYGNTKSNGFLNRIIGGANVKLLKGLRFEGVYGYIKGTSRTISYDDQKSYLVRSELVQFTVAPTLTSVPVYYLPNAGGRYSVNTLSQANWTVRNQLIYDNNWNNRLHQLTLLAGQEAQEQLSVINGSTVRGYNQLLQTFGAVDYATLRNTGLASPVMPNSSGKSFLGNDFFSANEMKTRFTSYYANAEYTFESKYVLNGSWRIDKSNLFGIDKSAQNRPVWSVGGKWLMSKEQFMPNAEWLNQLALRATYGITGNSPAPGTASSYDILAPQSSGFGQGLGIATPANRKLTWESTRSINIGLDFTLFKNRLNGSVDIYQKKTDNLLGSLPTNSFTGYSSITGNLGNMQNKGIEMSLGMLVINKKDFSWNTLFVMAYNKNEITTLNSVAPITTGAQKVDQRYFVGYPAFAIFAYKYAGLDSLGDPMIQLSNKTITKARNVATPDDVVFMGTYQPVWSGGWSNTFNYKQFGLAINAIYNLGNVMRRDVDQFYTGRLTQLNVMSQSVGSGFTGGNVNAEFADRWKAAGDQSFTNIPSYISSTSLSNSRRDVTYYTKADINVVSASYIKLRDVTLSYSLPKLLAERIKTDDITFRIQLSNIMLWKANHYGIDPEFQDAFTGIRSVPYNQRTVTVGLHVSF